MRRSNWIGIFFVCCGLITWGCAGSAPKALTENQTLLAVKNTNGYLKKVAMVQTPIPESVFDRNAGHLLFNTLAETIRKENKALQLVTSNEGGLPDLMAALPHARKFTLTAALSREGRRKGFNGLITTALYGVRAVPYNTGLLWFRSTKYRLEFEITLDIYDPFTGAKILSILEERSKKITALAYEEYKQGTVGHLEEMDEVLKALAESMGQQVLKAMTAHPWQASVAEVDGRHIVLSNGRQAGLRSGQRLAVVAGQRMLKGPGGETFVVPGPKIDMITISEINDNSAKAIADTSGKIKTGDIAVQTK